MKLLLLVFPRRFFSSAEKWDNSSKTVGDHFRFQAEAQASQETYKTSAAFSKGNATKCIYTSTSFRHVHLSIFYLFIFYNIPLHFTLNPAHKFIYYY